MKIESMLQAWLKLEITNQSPVDYLRKRGLKKIAIYGMGAMGYLFWLELQGKGIMVSYVADKRKNNWDYDVEYRKMEDMDPNVDAIVICSSNYASEIYNQIVSIHGDIFNILFLDDMIMQLLLE